MSPHSISDSFESEIAVVIRYIHCYMIDHNTEENYFNAQGIFYKE